MATIYDVAKKANVSTATVSRVINNTTYGVSEKTREKVLKSMKELNFQVNEIARSLVSQRTGIIAVVCDELADPSLIDMFRGFSSASLVSGYKLLYCNSSLNPDIKKEYIDFLKNGICDGIIIYGSKFYDEEIIKGLCAQSFPLVLIENEIQGLEVSSVLADDFDGAYKATEHLIKLGHKKIAHITGNMNSKVSLTRLNGYLRALQSNNIEVSEEYIQYGRFNYASGYNGLEKLLSLEHKPTAIFAADDVTAYGVIDCATKKRLEVPKDIAVVGVDDLKVFERVECGPKLTSVRLPKYEMAECSVKILVGLLKGDIQQPVRKVFKTKLIINDTCGFKA